MRLPLNAFIAAVLAMLAQTAAAQDPSVDPSVLRQEQRAASRLMRSAASAVLSNVDVTYYKLDLRVDPVTAVIAGNVIIGARVLASPLSQSSFALSSALTVDSVFVDGAAASYTRGNEAVTITSFPKTYTGGTSVQYRIFYHGVSSPSGFGSFGVRALGDGTQWLWTLSEPYGASDWWPCVNHPSDKADSADIWLTVPQGYLAGSEGVLTTVRNADSSVTYRWKHRYPISSYLISFAIANYIDYTIWYRWSATDSLPIVNYVLPSTWNNSLLDVRAQIDRVPAMMAAFESLFGPYPFRTEKYGQAEFGWGGGMEHQTMTSLGTNAFTETTIAHELAHQWFGDMITCRTWSDIWLNEGFATYCTGLYYERHYGKASYKAYMNSHIANARTGTFALHMSDTISVGSLFNGAVSYSKGAAVLHMLRHVLGDSLFFRAMRTYAETPRLMYSTASTADFLGVCETVSGRDLGWFFTQWLDQPGYPRYSINWNAVSAPPGYQVNVTIYQTLVGGAQSLYTMPLDLRLSNGVRDTTVVLQNSQGTQNYIITLPFLPSTVTLDPDAWILTEVYDLGADTPPRSFQLSPAYPNPFNPRTRLKCEVPRRGKVEVEVFSLLGKKVATLLNATMPPGEYTMEWNPVGIASGVYLCRLKVETTSNPPAAFTLVRKLIYVR